MVTRRHRENRGALSIRQQNQVLQARDGSSHELIPAVRSPERMTASTDHEQLLYFTSTSLTDDGRTMVGIVCRDDRYDLAAYDLINGQRRILTSHDPGYLKSYVYFDGSPSAGFGRASVSFDPVRRVLYYIHGREIRSVSLSGAPFKILAELPDNIVTAFTHVSSGGDLLCVPVTDARALSDEALATMKIDDAMQSEDLFSYINIYDTGTGELVATEAVERGWVTHVQFCPSDDRLVAFNHEWPNDCGIRRVWLWDRHTGSQRRMRNECDGRSRADWTCHEMWERDSSHLIYHGSYAQGPAYIGRVQPSSGLINEISLPASYTPYGHFTTGLPGWMVTDGYFVGVEGNPVGNWISLLKVDWSASSIAWYPLCASGSSWSSQDAHPHPIFDSDCAKVYFTSDKEGNRAIYSVDVSDLVLGRR